MIFQDAGFGKYYLSVKLDIENIILYLDLDESFFINPYKYTTVYHPHEKHEFFFVKKGECEIYIDNVFYNLSANNFILIPSGLKHRVCSVSNDAEIYPVKIMFSRNKVKQDVNVDVFALLQTIASNNQLSVFSKCSKIFEQIDKMTAIFTEKKKFYLDRLDAAAIEFMVEIVCFLDSLNIDYSKNITYKQYRNAQAYSVIIDGYFNTFYNKDITLIGLSEHLRLSVTHTKRLLKKIYGTGFVGLLTKTRITVAKELFLETNLPFEVIAEQIGYDSYKGFTYAFRKATGQTPNQFKKANNKKIL